jgi:hypothetical protein
MPANQAETISPAPRTVLSAKTVELAIVSYTDVAGMTRTQLCVLGDHTVLMLDSKGLGISLHGEPSGVAAPWLRDALFEMMGKPPVKE